MRHSVFFALAATLMPTGLQAAVPKQLEPLFAADRAWSEAAKTHNLVDGLVAMFDRDAVLVTGGTADLVRGLEAIRAKLAAKREDATSKIGWGPVGGGVSADGMHGFTYGAVTVRPQGGVPIAQKYLAYWVKRAIGWRVLAYKRIGRRETGQLNMAPPIIGAGKRSSDDPLVTLKQSEKAFSDEAQSIGLGAAFAKWGRPDSINIGAEDAVAVGSEAIGNGVAGPGAASPVSWAADEAVVAPSGDMGLSYGLLHVKNQPVGQPATIPFFTIWARPKPGDPWRYVAE